MKAFNITKNITAYCRSEKTRYGFRHLAELQENGYRTIATAKACYYNRTWESYEFQSVLEQLAENAKDKLTTRQYNRFKKLVANEFVIEEEKRVDKEFGTIAMIANLGELFGQTKSQKNDWKLRMIKAGLENKGLTVPEDWETLSEDEKEARLNKIIDQLGGE